MLELLTEALGFFRAVINSKESFYGVATTVIIAQTIAFYALWVSHMNKTISLKRKELGMNETDQAVKAVYKILHSHFLTKAKEAFGPDYFNRKETALYRYLLTMALEDRKPVFRVRIRRNHFDEKTPQEWINYVNDCIDEDIDYISRYLDEHYHPQARIPRPELYDHNEQKIPEIKKVLQHLFDELICIAKSNKLKKFFGVKLELGSN